MKRLHLLIASTLGAAMMSGAALAADGNAPPLQERSTGSVEKAAATDKANASAGETTLSRGDRTFLENAVQGSHAEIEASKMALEKSQSAAVKTFAEAMIKDHTAMIKEVTALAELKGYTPPEQPSVMQRTELKALSAMSGEAFDKMYVDRLGIASHEATIEQFEEAAKDADDPEVKTLAEKSLPKLKHHLEMAQALNEKQKTN